MYLSCRRNQNCKVCVDKSDQIHHTNNVEDMVYIQSDWHGLLSC